MKKKFIAVTAAASILLGGTAGAAGAAIFQQFGEDLKKDMHPGIMQSIAHMDRAASGERAYTVEVENEKQRIQKEVTAYLEKRTEQAALKAGQEDQKHVQEIKKQADAKIKEINGWINDLFQQHGY